MYRKVSIEELRLGQQRMRQRCLEVASVILQEAGVEIVTFHDKGLHGKAWSDERRIFAPRPTTRRRLYIVAHEAGHVHYQHGRSKMPIHRIEYEAERYAHDALRRHGIAVSKRSTEQAKRYVAWKINQAIKRGAKHIDRDALRWSEKYLFQATITWKAGQDGFGQLAL